MTDLHRGVMALTPVGHPLVRLTAEVLAVVEGSEPTRRVRAVLLDDASNAARSADVSVARAAVGEVAALDPLVDRRSPTMLEEFEPVDAGWRAAMARGGGSPTSTLCARVRRRPGPST